MARRSIKSSKKPVASITRRKKPGILVRAERSLGDRVTSLAMSLAGMPKKRAKAPSRSISRKSLSSSKALSSSKSVVPSKRSQKSVSHRKSA